MKPDTKPATDEYVEVAQRYIDSGDDLPPGLAAALLARLKLAEAVCRALRQAAENPSIASGASTTVDALMVWEAATNNTPGAPG